MLPVVSTVGVSTCQRSTGPPARVEVVVTRADHVVAGGTSRFNGGPQHAVRRIRSFAAAAALVSRIREG